MAVKLMVSGNQNHHPNYKEYVVDTPKDIQDLPTDLHEVSWGATAFVISTGDVYTLNSDYIWVQSKASVDSGDLNNGTGGSSNIAWLPSVSNEGVLSWTRSNSEVPPPVANIKGEHGKDATINGLNVINIVDSESVKVEIESNTMKFNALNTGSAGTTGVLFLSRQGNNAVLTHEMPTVSQQVTDRQWINANWGQWTEIASFIAADDVADKEVEFIPGNRFFSKIWLSSDVERPNAQLRLEATDMNDGTILAVATATVNLLNISSILTPVTFEAKYQELRVLPLSQVRTTLSIMVLAQGVQLGIVSNVPNDISYIAPISTSGEVSTDTGSNDIGYTLPLGGKRGAVLMKNSDDDGDAIWVSDGDIPWVIVQDPEYEMIEFNNIDGVFDENTLWGEIKAYMPTARSSFASGVIEGDIYCLGGGGSDSGYSNSNRCYDSITNSWSTKAVLPTGRSNLTSSVVNEIIYCIGGQTAASSRSSQNESYDHITNTWSIKASMPLGSRQSLRANEVRGIVYCIGGSTGSTSRINRNEAYDTVTNIWETKTNSPTNISNQTLSVVGEIVYCIGGETSSSSYVNQNNAYDPVSDSWYTRANMPIAKIDLTSSVIGDKIFCFCGMTTGNVYSNQVFVYDPVTNTWSEQSNAITARSELISEVVSGTIYCIGGRSGSGTGGITNRNEAYSVHTYEYADIEIEVGDFVVFSREVYIGRSLQRILANKPTIALHSGTIHSQYPFLSGIIKRRREML